MLFIKAKDDFCIPTTILSIIYITPFCSICKITAQIRPKAVVNNALEIPPATSPALISSDEARG